jgi:hypothetical protein
LITLATLPLCERPRCDASKIRRRSGYGPKAGPRRARGGPEDRDWTALAVVLTGAIALFWPLRDVFGTQPGGIDEDRYIAAFSNLAEGLFNGNGPDASTDRQIGTGP